MKQELSRLAMISVFSTCLTIFKLNFNFNLNLLMLKKILQSGLGSEKFSSYSFEPKNSLGLNIFSVN